MTKISLKFRTNKSANSAGSIYYQVNHKHERRTFSSGHKIEAKYWDTATSTVNVHCHLYCDIMHDIKRIQRIIDTLGNSNHYFSCNDIICQFRVLKSTGTIFNIAEQTIARLKETGRMRTAQAYQQTLNSFRQFLNNNDMLIDTITAEVVEAYQAYLRQRNNALNTISFHMRILRSIYNKAARKFNLPGKDLFSNVFTGLAPTKKRALSPAIMSKIKNLPLIDRDLIHARNIFLLSFYLRGMSFIDMAFLHKKDLRNGRITYLRHKTGQLLEIEWLEEMQDIINSYPPNPTKYLLPIITKKDINEYSAYRRACYKINKSLKQIAAAVGAPSTLSLYCARHSWASVAKSKHIPISVISEAMGHNSEKTTQIYLSSLETSIVDHANQLIISSI